MPLRDTSGAFDWIVIFSKHSMLSFHEVFGQNTELFLEALGEIGRSIEAGHVANLIDSVPSSKMLPAYSLLPAINR